MNPQHAQNKLVRVRPEENFTTKRNLNYFPGISENTAGTQGLSMMLVRIPPGVPHQPINLSDTEPAMASVSRNIASEQEPVVPYDPKQSD